MTSDFDLSNALSWDKATTAFPWLSEIEVGNGIRMTEEIYNKQLSRSRNAEMPDGAESYIPVSTYGKAFLTKRFFGNLLRFARNQPTLTT